MTTTSLRPLLATAVLLGLGTLSALAAASTTPLRVAVNQTDAIDKGSSLLLGIWEAQLRCGSNSTSGVAEVRARQSAFPPFTPGPASNDAQFAWVSGRTERALITVDGATKLVRVRLVARNGLGQFDETLPPLAEASHTVDLNAVLPSSKGVMLQIRARGSYGENAAEKAGTNIQNIQLLQSDGTPFVDDPAVALAGLQLDSLNSEYGPTSCSILIKAIKEASAPSSFTIKFDFTFRFIPGFNSQEGFSAIVKWCGYYENVDCPTCVSSYFPKSSSGSDGNGSEKANDSQAGIEGRTGKMASNATDIASNGFSGYAAARAHTNGPRFIGADLFVPQGVGDQVTARTGNRWMNLNLPALHVANGRQIIATAGPETIHRFVEETLGTFTPAARFADSLRHDAPAREMIWTDAAGNQAVFHDFTTTTLAPPVVQYALRGHLKRYVDAAGNLTTFTRVDPVAKTVGVTQNSATVTGSGFDPAWVPGGRFQVGIGPVYTISAVTATTLTLSTTYKEATNASATSTVYPPSVFQVVEVLRSHTQTLGGVATTTTESWTHAYGATGAAAGRITATTLRRKVNAGAFQTVRIAQYDYYGSGDPNGNNGDLRLATITDAGGAVLDRHYYRYHLASGATDNFGPLKFAVGPEAYERLKADAAVGSDAAVLTATDAKVEEYADAKYLYDSQLRVSSVKLLGKGCGCGAASAGTYTYTYTYTAPHQLATPQINPDGVNSWQMKTVETQPDGNQTVTYANTQGTVLLREFIVPSSGLTWRTFTEYDARGRSVLTANPSAITGKDETKPDLLNKDTGTGKYQFLSDTAGLLHRTSYFASTNIAAGQVAGYVQATTCQLGENGTPIKQAELTYTQRSGAPATEISFPVASSKVFRNADGTGAITTTFAYTFLGGGTVPAIESTTATLPIVTTAQNGPNTAVQTVQFQDSYGRSTWRKDEDGFLHYQEYDDATGATLKTITDVNSATTADFTGKPASFTTPAGGGLHLKTLYETDFLGRVTKLTEPNGNVTFTVYKDATFEVRTYPGFTATSATSGTTTGPIRVSRMDRPGSYRETLSMAPAPTVAGSRPTGAEAVSALQTLARSYLDKTGRATISDTYIDFTGVTYAVTPFLGTLNTNFVRSTVGYDALGRQDKGVDAQGTITRTFYDAPGRVSSQWIGLDDVPTSGDWSPTNTAGTDLVKVQEDEYDGNGVGDGNRTKTTLFVNGTAADNRVTAFFYDFRNRLVVTKSGVQASEATSVQRPIVYCDLDNLGRCVVHRIFDGDSVAITSSGGVPQPPAASLLRQRRTTSFDEQGRVFRTEVFAVNPGNGTVGGAMATNTVFNHRGLTVKIALPGGLVQKVAYDGAKRTTSQFATDGGGDVSFADTLTVDGDAVLNQDAFLYDASGNVLMTTTKQRFHDETATGALNSPGTAPKCRRSFVAFYYDKANRRTDTVDMGTNGGASFTRPASPAGRSDTVLRTTTTYDLSGWVQDIRDPRDIVTRHVYDRRGLCISYTEAFDAAVNSGNPSGDKNRRTLKAYNGNGQLVRITADAIPLPGTGSQVTEYVYGIRTTGTTLDSQFNSNSVLFQVRHPDKTTGAASTLASDHETVAYNRLGERIASKDPNGNQHDFLFDVVGRPIRDTVSTLGVGVSGTTRRQDVTYDSAGRIEFLRTFSDTGGTTRVSDCRRLYNDLGQLKEEQQAIGSLPGTPLKVQYLFSLLSGGNHSRLTQVIYPNGRKVRYEYSTGLDNTISRLSFLADDNAGAVGTTLESYSYLGLSAVIRRAHPQPGVDLTYIKQGAEANGDAGDQYTGLDRFGRLIDQRWLKTSDGSHTDRIQYGYDRAGNKLFAKTLTTGGANFSEIYHVSGVTGNGAYDALGRMKEFVRGTITGSNNETISTPVDPDTADPLFGRQVFTLDQLGNHTSVSSDGTAQARTHNRQNQATTVAGLTSPVHDNNGNMITDERGATYVFDAFNRLVSATIGGTTKTYKYDALNRQIAEVVGATTRQNLHTAKWQVVEERVNGTTRVQHVWSPIYVDALVLREDDSDSNGSLERRLYAQQEREYDVMAVINTAGVVQERFAYDAYGARGIFTVAFASTIDTLAWRYGHTGRYHDQETGLTFFRARYYSSSLGHFTMRDPAWFVDGLNLYGGYFTPSRTDPFGLHTIRAEASRPGDDAGETYETARIIVDLNIDTSKCKWVDANAGIEPSPYPEGTQRCDGWVTLSLNYTATLSTAEGLAVGAVTGGTWQLRDSRTGNVEPILYDRTSPARKGARFYVNKMDLGALPCCSPDDSIWKPNSWFNSNKAQGLVSVRSVTPFAFRGVQFRGSTIDHWIKYMVQINTCGKVDSDSYLKIEAGDRFGSGTPFRSISDGEAPYPQAPDGQLSNGRVGN